MAVPLQLKGREAQCSKAGDLEVQRQHMQLSFGVAAVGRAIEKPVAESYSRADHVCLSIPAARYASSCGCSGMFFRMYRYLAGVWYVRSPSRSYL